MKISNWHFKHVITKNNALKYLSENNYVYFEIMCIVHNNNVKKFNINVINIFSLLNY